MMGHKSGLHKVAWILLIIGGLNWLLFGLFNWEIGSLVGGMGSVIAKIIYILVGLSALYLLFAKMGHKNDMGSGGGMGGMNMPK
jgi:uncharacterized membrane protein YuzA (DUF378 family)